MQTEKEYLESLSPETRVLVADIMVKKHFGIVTADDAPESCTGCEATTPNGGCFVVDGACVWIPEIGEGLPPQ